MLMTKTEVSLAETTGKQADSPFKLPAVSTILISLFSLLLLCSICLSYSTSQPVYPPGSLPPLSRGGGAGSCRMSYMSPSYIRVSGFGREYSRLAGGPWALYLYKEVGWDTESKLDDDGTPLALNGSPVIFVPGNAGSFRQVRSLAGAASRTYWELPRVKRKGIGGKGSASLDFFTLDFNDDFSAFHGQTLLDQAEYLADAITFILSLYQRHQPQDKPDPTSLIVIGHSMGGIVARAAFLHPHYQAHSISTLITIATPHVVPPATVDRGVDQVYDDINSYWRQGYGLEFGRYSERAREELSDSVMISLSGGLSDTTIASEAVSLSSLLPSNNSHGFTVFTTSIPGIYTPIDHLALLWCEQLLQKISLGILSIIDVNQARGVMNREARIAKLGDKLLGGLEIGSKRIEGREVTLESLSRDGKSTPLNVGERLIVRADELQGRNLFVMPIPPTRTYGSALVFTLLTSSNIGRSRDSAVEVYACSPNDAEDADSSPVCAPLFPSHASMLPLSSHAQYSPILPTPTEDGTLGHLTIDISRLQSKTSVVVIVKSETDWVLAEYGDRVKRVQVVEKTVLQLLLGGFRLESFPSSPSLVSELWIPALDTSLLTLKLQVFRGECQESTALFAPLVRQYSPLLHESKYYPNVRTASLYTHSSGPFLPSSPSPFTSSGSRLQFYLDPSCTGKGSDVDVAIEITVDIWATLGNLVVRYRMAAVAFPFSLVMLIIARQLHEYNAGNSFLAFGSALTLFIKDTLLPLLGFLTAASLVQSIVLATHLAAYTPDSGHPSQTSLPPSWVSDLLLGNKSASYLFLAAFIVFSCVGAVVAEYAVLQSLVGGAAWVVKTFHQKGPKRFRSSSPGLSEPREALFFQRLLSMGILLLVVLFFAPHQFAFLVIFLVHFFSTVRSLLVVQDLPATPAATKRLWDRYHYSFSILFIMFCLLPINALILVVWVRNLAVGWLAPFASDHNVFSVIGFLLNVEAIHSGKMLSRTKNRIRAIFTTLLPTVTAAYGLLYGIRYTHDIFPLANVFYLWLAAMSSEAIVGVVHDVVVGKRKNSLSSLPSPREIVAVPLRTTKR